MTEEAKILIIDDDRSFLEIYEEILREDGHLIATATDRSSALAQLDHGPISAVILDQKLQGFAGPDSGLDLLSELQRRRPEAKILIVTGYANPTSVERAFAAGAHDFLEKSAALPAILKAKLRNLTALYRAEQQAHLSREGLHQLFRSALSEENTQRKGKLFEDFVASLFRSIPELFSIAGDPRRRNDIEEIDLILINRSKDPPWSGEAPYILAECKNWSSTVGRGQYDVFRAKITRRGGRSSLGFFIAPGGVSPEFREALRRDAHQPPYVLILDRPVIERLIDAPDRVAVLRELHLAAAFNPSAK